LMTFAEAAVKSMFLARALIRRIKALKETQTKQSQEMQTIVTAW